jgi:hypothetical protein
MAPMTVTPSSFQAQFPEFASTPQTLIQTWLTASVPFFNTDRWDDLLDLGVAYWVAHQIVAAQQNAAAQTTDDTIMQKEGDVSYQRDSVLVNRIADNPYLSTPYGKQYLYYMKFVGAGGIAL